MKKICAIIVLIIISCALYAEPVLLEFKHEGNEINVYKERNRVTQTDGGETVNAETETEVTERLKSPLPELTIESTVKPISITVNGEEGDLDKAKEQTFSYKLDKRGKVTAAFNENGEENKGVDLSKQIGLLPDKPVNAGDTWQGMLIMDTLNCPLECRLNKVYTKNGVEVAEISFTVDYTEDVKDTLSGMELPDEIDTSSISGGKTVKGSGTVYFSIKLGKYIMVEYEIDNDTKISIMGQELALTEKVDYKMWRIR